MTRSPESDGARRVLLASVRSRKPAFRRLAAWSVLEALPALLSGLLVATAIDDGFLAGDLETGFSWLGAFGLSVVIGAWGTRQTLRQLAGVVEPFRDELVTGVVSGALRRSTVPGASPATADAARLTQQVEIVREAYAAVLMVVQQFVVVTVAALIGLLTLEPIVLLFVAPPFLVAVAMFTAALRRMADQQRAFIMADERFAEAASGVGAGLRDVVACGGEDSVATTVGRHIDAQAAATKALGRLTAVGSVAVSIGTWLPLLLVLAAGSWLLGRGSTTGVIIGTVTYLLQGLQPALQTLVQGLSGPGLWLMVTLRRVVSAMETAPDLGASDAAGLDSGLRDPDLQVHDVTFAYSEWAAPVVHDLDLTVPSGDHLAIVGPSGVGKSTLAGLMTGLLVPQAGTVSLGGVGLDGVSAFVLARHRVLIPQEAYVFAGTLRENLAYLCEDVSLPSLDAAVDRLGARQLVDRIGGYDASVDPSSLSAGERQLITLVRAYVSPASLVILDEATCHLDPAAEALAEAAFGVRPGTLVVIAHRMSSALRAKRILVMDGASVEVGTHAELFARSPLYQDLIGHWQAATGPEPLPLTGRLSSRT